MRRNHGLDADPEAVDGLLAIAVAKMAGCPARYRDPLRGWVLEYPDGTIEPFAGDDPVTESRPCTIRIAR